MFLLYFCFAFIAFILATNIFDNIGVCIASSVAVGVIIAIAIALELVAIVIGVAVIICLVMVYLLISNRRNR